MYYTYALGHDFGNANTCNVKYSNSKEPQVLTMPSALYEGSYQELLNRLKGSSSATSLEGILGDTAHTIIINGNQWFVGDLAIKQATNVPLEALTARNDISRYWSDRNLAMLLATSGTLIKDPEFGLGVVTNLPIETHTDLNVKKVRAALEGDHQFFLDGNKRIAHVRVKKVIMEGAGANIAFGKPGNERRGIIDIGGQTTDCYMVEGLIPTTNQCKSIALGVEGTVEELINRFERIYDYPLTPGDATSLFYTYTRDKNYQTIATIVNTEAKNEDIDDLINNILRETGKQIAGFIKRTWTNKQNLRSEIAASDVLDIILVGGGAYYFEQDLRPLFNKRLRVPENPEYANAMGYAKLSLHYLQREMKSA